VQRVITSPKSNPRTRRNCADRLARSASPEKVS
jgi:hypothetical protein